MVDLSKFFETVGLCFTLLCLIGCSYWILLRFLTVVSDTPAPAILGGKVLKFTKRKKQ